MAEYPDVSIRHRTCSILTWCSVGAVAIVVFTAPWASDMSKTMPDLVTAVANVVDWMAAPPRWSAAAAVALFFPCLLLPGLAWLFHSMDGRRGGGGVKSRVRRRPPPRSSTDPSVISATMTKQSILAAIAAIFLTGAEHGSFVANDYALFTIALSRLGLSVALLLLIVSVLSYDYANRFNLDPAEKIELVRKGLRLDVFAWYVLVASYIVGIAARHILTSIGISIAMGYLVWWYYFIETHPEREAAKRLGKIRPKRGSPDSPHSDVAAPVANEEAGQTV